MKYQTNDSSNWASLSDIMTGLMVIFLFIAIAYMVEAEKKQAERDLMFEEFKATKEELYHELDSVFQDDFREWQVELDNDLSIKFTNPEILFQSGKSRIRTKFRIILDSFFPRYLDIVMQEKYQGKIAEIRIEGHTDPVPVSRRRRKSRRSSNEISDTIILDQNIIEEENTRFDRDDYISNVELSQDRAREVLKHVRKLRAYKKLSNTEHQLLQYWLTANGLSYGRTLDDNRELTHKTGNVVNNLNSRRVEFKIVTSSDVLIEKVLKQLK